MPDPVMLSVIVCTYRRAEALGDLLDCLAAQTYRGFEILIVDGSGEDPAVRQKIESLLASDAAPSNLRLISSPKGLTRQRNLGLRECQGQVICFFDDDITMGPGFLAALVETLQAPGMQDVGGITGYDMLNHSLPITPRWRLRSWLGSAPKLRPGSADHLGRCVPISFAAPTPGCTQVEWLGGCCMCYRREAISNLRFDEELPTYAGEDLDFSIAVGRSWRLVVSGELPFEHHRSPVSRDSELDRVYQVGFGLGRGFAKRDKKPADYLIIARHIVSDLIVDSMTLAMGPSINKLLMIFARPVGMAKGFRSITNRRYRADGLRETRSRTTG